MVQSLELWQKVHAEAKPKLLQFLLDTATVLKKAGKLDEAYTTLEEARTTLSAQRGESDAEVQGLVVGLAELKMKQQKPEEALPLYEGALKVLHDTSSPQEVQLLHLMVSIYESQKNTEMADKMKAALKVAQEKHGST